MSNRAALRASSMLVSAGLLGGIAVLALTFSIALPAMRPVEPGPIVDMFDPPPPPPTPVVRTQPNPPPTPSEDSELTDALPPLPPITTTQPETTRPVWIETRQIITNPHWLRRPRDLQRYYPRRALELGVEGYVMLDCTVAVTGNLGCSVVSETPTNWGFGDAALRIAADHRMAPAMRDGVAVEGRYRMRVPFRAE
jgi:protein TonB